MVAQAVMPPCIYLAGAGSRHSMAPLDTERARMVLNHGHGRRKCAGQQQLTHGTVAPVLFQAPMPSPSSSMSPVEVKKRWELRGLVLHLAARITLPV